MSIGSSLLGVLAGAGIDPLTGVLGETVRVVPFGKTVVEAGEVKLEFNPLAETVAKVGELELEVIPTEGFALDVPVATVEFSEEVSLGVDGIVEVKADPTGVEELKILGFEATEPISSLQNLIFLATLSQLL